MEQILKNVFYMKNLIYIHTHPMRQALFIHPATVEKVEA